MVKNFHTNWEFYFHAHCALLHTVLLSGLCSILIVYGVVVQESPCPTTVRSPENEDSEVETGLKSQEDSDSVEAKSE